MRCFYSQELELELPSGHPFPMEKFRVSKDMLLDGGILRPEEIIEVSSASMRWITFIKSNRACSAARSNFC